MIKYTLVLAFSNDLESIALIEKQSPAWQKGKLNGIGGKFEETDKSIKDCAIREFEEETGVLLEKQNLYYIGENYGNTYSVDVFTIKTDKIFQCKTIEKEVVKILKLDDLKTQKTIDNVPILIDLAKHFHTSTVFQEFRLIYNF